jgi:exopolysaccharide biosynthesis polyprenyl glycosylphosphotransferase
LHDLPGVLTDQLRKKHVAEPEPRVHPQRDYVLRRLLALADGLGVTVALGAAVLVAGKSGRITEFGLTLMLVPLWILLFKLYGLYDRDGKRVSHSTVDDVPSLFSALLSSTLALWMLTHYVSPLQLDFPGAAVFLIVALPAVFMTRATVRSVAYRLSDPDRVLFVGGGEMACLLLDKIGSHREYALKPIGFVDGDSDESEAVIALPSLGDLADLEEICLRFAVDRIIVASPKVDESTLVDLVRLAGGLDLRISILPQLSDVLGPSVTIDDVEGITVLGVNPQTLSPSSRLLKRAMDLSIVVPALTLALPLMGVIAVLVKLTSSGPIFYRQQRIGRNGRRFHICKFRTMVADAELLEGELKKLSAHPVWLLLDRDPRVTKVGRVLRKLSLDELPQLWNVVRGDMSLVGPRPMPPEVDEQINGWGRRRLDLTPGITGLWQVLGRTSIPFEEMLKLDYLYVTNWSIWNDVRLLIRTLPAVLKQRGAN